MAKYTVIGVENSVYKRNGKDFNVMLVHCISDEKILNGQKTKVFKITNNIGLIDIKLVGEFKIEFFYDLVGCEVEPTKNKLGEDALRVLKLPE